MQLSSDNFSTCLAFTASAPTFSTNNTIATFTLASTLANTTTYKVRVTTGAAAANGNALGADNTQATGFQTAGGDSIATNLVISEVSTTDAAGTGVVTGAARDYIEIYNPTTNPVNINGWKIRRKTSGGSFAAFITITADTCANTDYTLYNQPCVVPAKGFFLLTASDYTPANGAKGDYVGWTAALANTNNGIQLTDAADSPFDAVCFGTHTLTTGCEGATITDPAAAGSLERKARVTSTNDTNATTGLLTGGGHATYGNGQDSGVSSADWFAVSSKSPQNRYTGGTEQIP